MSAEALRWPSASVNTFTTSSLDPATTAHRGVADVVGPSCAVQPAATTCMLPLFHFKNQDTIVTAMQHNSHFHLLAMLTSDNEIYVSGTQHMPAFEQVSGVLYRCADSLHRQPNVLVTDSSLLGWDASRHTICIDALPYSVTQICWAPWQNGIYFAALCPGRGLHFYRYSHSRWTREDLLHHPTCLQMSFSPVGYAIALAGGSAGLQVFTRLGHHCEANRWEESQAADTGPDKAFCQCVAWDSTGVLLSAGFRDAVHVFTVAWEGTSARFTRCSTLPALHRHADTVGFRQLVWAPMSGRSFVMLLGVSAAHGVAVSLFRRPAGLSDSVAAPQRVRVTSLHHMVSVPLQCPEVINAVWNTTGTRFVTSHRDSSVNAWRVEVAPQQRRLRLLPQRCPAPLGWPQPTLKATGPTCHFSAPTVSIRHVSSVQPFQYGGA